MSRIARVVVPEVPHHVTQRGNRRLQTFFCDEDYEAYIDLMSQWCTHWNVEVWAYCLMPNHIHLIAVPPSEKALSRAIGEAHRCHTRRVNFREGWRGHLWQGRFASFPMDKTHLYVAARYVELNPVRANLVKKPQEYRWSSASACIAGQDDRLVQVAPLLEMFGEWSDFLSRGLSDEEVEKFRCHERTGRPLGTNRFIARLENVLGRMLNKQKPSPKALQKKNKNL
ncbi:MAG: transposase [Candidatus Brocadia sp. UTAMX2]|nr:MAG: transposase [Candidatus Brocadia sp. UTAMX2]